MFVVHVFVVGQLLLIMVVCYLVLFVACYAVVVFVLFVVVCVCCRSWLLVGVLSCCHVCVCFVCLLVFVVCYSLLVDGCCS